MIDIHSHVVWGVDDGPGDIEQSLTILQDARASGTTDMVATSHFNLQYPYQLEVVENRIAELAVRTGNQPRLYRGCEFLLSFENFDRMMDQPSMYTINGTQYLLVEWPSIYTSSVVDTALRRLMGAGITPVIAHPERNPMLRDKFGQIESWVESGCLMQLTALSITGGFGAAAKTTSFRLLDQGLAHVVASDTHDPVRRHPRMDEALKVIQARYGRHAAEILFDQNPRNVLEGTPMGGKQEFGRPSMRRFWFWKARE